MGYEVDFLPVGDSNGDAICIRYGDDVSGYTIHVVDGAYTATGQDIINFIRQQYHPNPYIQHMVLSHACNDHAPGLVPVLEEFDVGTLWMNLPWLYVDEIEEGAFHGNYGREGIIRDIKEKHPYLVELEEIAIRKGTTISPVFQGMQIGVFRVLAPSRQRYISIIPRLDKTPEYYGEKANPFNAMFGKVKDAVQRFVEERWNVETLSNNIEPTSPSNESCVVQLGTFGEETVLLTADVGPDGLTEAAQYAYNNGILKPPHFIQVPHHGSRHNVTPRVLDWWLGTALPTNASPERGTAYCSVGANKPQYPRKKVSNAFRRRGYPVSSTRTKYLTFGRGMTNRGWSPLETEPFHNDVEE